MDSLIYPIVRKRKLPFIILLILIINVNTVNGEANNRMSASVSFRTHSAKLYELLDCLSNGNEGTTTSQPFSDLDENTTPSANNEPIRNADCFSDPALTLDIRSILRQAEDASVEIERLSAENQKLTSTHELLLSERNKELSQVQSKLTGMTKEMEALEHELNSSQAVVGKQGREISRMWKNMELMETQMMEMNRTTLALKLEESSDILKLKEDIKGLSTQLKEKNTELGWVKTAFYKNPEWNSELHLAVGEKDLEAVKTLLKFRGAYIDERNRRLETPIIMAAATRGDKGQYLPVIKYLIEEGADVHARDKENRTFLHNLLGEDGEIPLTPGQFHDLVVFLVGRNMQKIFSATPEGGDIINPLLVALSNIEVEYRTLQLLQNNGVKLGIVRDAQSNSILFYPLLGRRSTNLLHDIISLGVDRLHLNNQNQSLLHIASQFCYAEGVNYFLGVGLDINALDGFGDTPLHKAVKYGEGEGKCLPRTLRVLVENWANVQVENDEGLTPLSVVLGRKDVVGKNRREVIQLLKGSQAINSAIISSVLESKNDDNDD